MPEMILPARILGLASALPAYAYAQADLSQTLLRLVPLPQDEAERFKRMSIASAIGTRYSVLPDYQGGAERLLYHDNLSFDPSPSLEDRMACYHQLAPPLALQAVAKLLANQPLKRDQITHLITVSCTGLAAPGLDLMLLRSLELPLSTHRSAVNFMGCYAAMHGLKQADAICRADPKALVLVVCVELCTLHFQKDANPDNLAASLLFADGAAAALVAGAEIETASKSLILSGFYSEIVPQGWQDMAWQLSGQGFLMRLSAYVPELLRQGLRQLVGQALKPHGLDIPDIGHWALHPGGRKILDYAWGELKLPDGALDCSYQVLKNCGNMSSATILFVLEQLWPQLQPEAPLFAAAFGPGLTMETFTGYVV